jgi:hypothetical protein
VDLSNYGPAPPRALQRGIRCLWPLAGRREMLRFHTYVLPALMCDRSDHLCRWLVLSLPWYETARRRPPSVQVRYVTSTTTCGRTQ